MLHHHDFPALEFSVHELNAGVALGLARARFDAIDPAAIIARAEQRIEVERLADDVDANARRADADPVAYRAALQHELRKRLPAANLTPIAPPALRDGGRRRLEGARLGAEHEMMDARARLRAAERRQAACPCNSHLEMRRRKAADYENAFIAADRALVEYDRAQVSE